MDAVCFDMDGVVVNSEDYWHELERAEILPTVVPDQDVDLDELTGVYYKDIYDILDREYDVAVDRETFVRLYEDAAERIYGEHAALTEGLRPLVEDLRDRGVAIALVTSSPPMWYEVVLDRFGLGDLFDAVLSAETLDGEGKPAPDIYAAAAAELGVDPADAVAVEDSVHGVTAARAAGMDVIGFGVGAAAGGHGDAPVVAEDVEALRAELLDRV